MGTFSTKALCAEYIKKHGLNAIPVAQYSEDNGEILYWYIYYMD